MAHSLTCWQCGAALEGLPLPLGRSAECPRCRAALRVCRLCAFHDQRASRECREPQAEPVREKERANFCDYFRPRAGGETSSASAQTRSSLDDLFGGSAVGDGPQSGDAARQALDRLFGKK